MRTERDWDNYLVYGLPLPFTETIEVPLPTGYFVCMDCGQVSNHYPQGGICAPCEAKTS